jgi:carbonic anhydrase/acetyltransferase-like protein (isoleucine patch superfamily)
MPLLAFRADTPTVAPSAFIAPDAWIIGKATIGDQSSVFFNAVVRGDIQPITVGSRTNLQEHVLVHSSHGMSPVIIGDQVTVGHRAILHGCTIGNCSLIGMGATILDNVTIGEHSIIGAHTLLTKGTVIPPRSLVVGSPGRIIRTVNESEVAELEQSSGHYVELGAQYLRQFSA